MTMPTFTDPEMVKLFEGAKDKKKQIAIFCDTQQMTEDEVRKALVAAGLDHRRLPRREKRKAPDPDASDTLPTEAVVPTADPLADIRNALAAMRDELTFHLARADEIRNMLASIRALCEE